VIATIAEQRKRKLRNYGQSPFLGTALLTPKQTFLYLFTASHSRAGRRPRVVSVWVDVVLHAASNRIQQRPPNGAPIKSGISDILAARRVSLLVGARRDAKCSCAADANWGR